jgi:hypothetical protein
MVKRATILSLVFAWALALSCCVAADVEGPMAAAAAINDKPHMGGDATDAVRSNTVHLGELPASFFFARGLLYPEARTVLRSTGRKSKGCPA